MFLQSRVLIDPSSVTVTEKKNPKVPQLFFFLFFSLAPPFPFLHSLSSTIHYECVTGSRRLARGEQCVVTLSAALQLSAWFPTPSPSRPWRVWGGGRGRRPLHTSTLPPPPPESIAPRHHTNDPPKSMHHRAMHHQQRPAMWFRTWREFRTESYYRGKYEV